MKTILKVIVLAMVLAGTASPMLADGADPAPTCNPFTNPNCSPPIPPAQ